MKKLLFFTLITFLSITVVSQSCLPEGIEFTTQAQVDNFQTDYPGCTEIEGDVLIYGYDITNLDGLNVLTSIGGDLIIWYTPLVTLTGLDNLSFLGGAIVIGAWGQNAMPDQPIECYGNPFLKDITALSGLPSKKNGVHIFCNQSLVSLAVLENTDFIDGDLMIMGNDSLIDLSAFSNLDTITGSLHLGIAPAYDYFGINNFRGNDRLSNCMGLHNLKYIGNNLEIAGNNNLESLAGLENLYTIGGDLRIYGNTLTNLEGINSIRSIGGNLMIVYNDSLNNLSGFENLEAGSINNLVIAYNNNLTDCMTETICNYLSNPGGTVDIVNNSSGCNSQQEVEEACLSYCLPEGITFTTQEQIDNFQTDYPGCTEIAGNVYIYGDDITNLNGLNCLTSIGGNLGIGLCESGGGGNPLLNSLEGLDNLISVEGNVHLYGNDGLENLTGLNKLASIGGYFYIELYFGSTLNGLDSLTSIGGDLNISYNQSLSCLTGLNNLNSIGGDLIIDGNDNLTTIAGLDNLNSATINNIWIIGNPSLFDCDVESICNYLSSPNGEVNILNNASGCNNPGEIALMCGFSIPCLPYGNYLLYSQDEIDNFAIYYPECYELKGLVDIGGNYGSGSDVINLDGLSTVTNISGDLQIRSTELLINLTGLDNITSVTGNLEIGSNEWWVNGNTGLKSLSSLSNLDTVGGDLVIVDNDSLASLSGLENLIYIGGNLQIGAEAAGSVRGNPLLMNLYGLENLTLTGGSIAIIHNPSLTSLSGLDNIDANSIENLYIAYNTLLSTCEVESVCAYLSNPNGEVWITENAPGCNSQQEVEEACASSINEIAAIIIVSITPNPFTSSTTLSYELKQPEKVTLSIFNHLGQIVYQTQENQSQGNQQLLWNASGYPEGVYYYRLKVCDAIANGKMVKVK